MAKIEVVYSVWGVGDEAAGDAQVFDGGVQDVVLTTPLAKYIAGGAAAGVVRVLEATDAERALLEGHVESQEDSEAAYEKAVEDGVWHEGNLMQFVSQTEQRLALSDEEANLTPGDRIWLTNGLADAHETLGNQGAADRIRRSLEGVSVQEIGPQDIASAQAVLGGDIVDGNVESTDEEV